MAVILLVGVIEVGLHLRSPAPQPEHEKIPALAADVAAHVLPALGAGRLQIPVYDTFPLAEAEAAYDHFAAGSKFGKVVLVAP